MNQIATKQIVAQLKRCAVCKIDLKGRFVYVDEEIEHLLGYTKEELFGKSIAEFTSEESQTLIDAVLIHRNHYESFYDATSISLVDRNNRRIDTSAIISLNFIAGNPVNYQLIIHPDSDDSSIVSLASNRNCWPGFLESLTSMEDPLNLGELCGHLRHLLGARGFYIYLLSETELAPRAGSSFDNPEFGFQEIPVPTALHAEVAASGRAYNFLDESGVSRAVELLGEAPLQIICRAEIGSGATYLFTAEFDPDLAELDGNDPLEKLYMALRLVTRFVASDNSSQTDDQSVDLKFTVGFLDSIGIGAMILSSEGQAVGYNPTFANLMQVESFSGTVHDLLERITPWNSADVASAILGYLTAQLPENSDGDLSLEFVAPNGERFRLIVVRFCIEADDMSACLVFMPLVAQERQHGLAEVEDSLMKRILESIGDLAGEAHEVSRRISHEHYSRLNKSGKELLRRFEALSLATRSGIADFEQSEKMAENKNPNQEIDINLIVDQALESVTGRFPTVEFVCRRGELPLIKGDPELLGRLLEAIFEQVLRLGAETKMETSLAGSITGSSLELSLSHTVPPLHQAMNAEPRPNKKTLSRSTKTHGLQTVASLLAARYLAQRIGGDLVSIANDQGGFDVCLNLPIEN